LHETIPTPFNVTTSVLQQYQPGVGLLMSTQPPALSGVENK